MSSHFLCPQGHRWPPANEARVVPPICPQCGAAALPEPLTIGTASRQVEADSQDDTIARPDAPFHSPAVESFAAVGYEILGELARGGMGVVYKARQLKLNRLVALKMILAGAHAGPQELERFRREAEAVAALHHPNIVQIYEVGDLEGRPFFSLEFVEGGSLAQQTAGDPQDPRQSARLIAVLARTMHYAHERGIIHRDLKPANVLLKADGTPKITDFGLAKRLEADSSNTHTGAILGTPSYIAPEQAAGRTREIGPAVDVYALGAILYELLTGRPPFRGQTAMDTMLQVMSEEPVPPTRLQPKVQRELETICLKALHKEPRKRYATGQHLADDLERFLAGEPIHARPIGWVGRGLKWARRRPAAAALLVVSGLALLSLLAGSLWYNALLQEKTRLAEQRRLEAVQQEAVAREKEREAQQQTELARAQLENARRSLYALQLTQVAAVWQREPSRGLELLEDTSRCPHDLLDFTWSHLYSLCQRHHATYDGHTKPVSAVASHAGGLLATGSWDHTVILWKPKNYFPASSPNVYPMVLKGHAGLVLALAFAPDGKTLASAGEDGTIRIWDVATGKELAVLDDPGNWIKGVAFAPDGKTLASASSDGMVKIWDLDKKTIQATLKGHQGPVTAVVYCLNGQVLASAGQDRSIRLWDVAKNQEMGNLAGHKDVINALAVSPDGKTLASGSGDGTVRLWDPQAHGSRLAPLDHGGTVYAVTFDPDGRTLASGGKDGTVKLWHPLSGEQRCVLHDPPGPVLGLAFTYGGSRLATGSAGDTNNLKIWEIDPRPSSRQSDLPAESGPCLVCGEKGNLLAYSVDSNQVRLRPLSGNETIVTLQRDPLKAAALASTADAQIIAIGEADGRITIWDAATGKLLHAFERSHTGGVRSLAFLSKDLLVSGGDDKVIRLWNLATWKPEESLAGHLGTVTVLSKAPGRSALASGDDNGRILVWNLEKREQAGLQPLTLDGHNVPVRCLVWSPDGQRLASAASNPHQREEPGELKVWDPVAGRELLTLSGHTGPVLTLVFQDRGEVLASAGEDRTIRLWDPVTGQERSTLTGHAEAVQLLWFSRTDSSLLTVSRDGHVRRWSSSKLIWSLPLWRHNAAVTGLALADDDETLAAVSRDGVIKIGHLPTGQERLAIKGHAQGITSVAFAPQGKVLATGCLDGSAKIWAVQGDRLQERAVLQGHQGTVWCVAFSPDGQRLATAGEDQTIRLWNTAGQLLTTWQGHQAPVLTIAFAPDGQTLAAGDGSGKVLLWDATTGEVRATLEQHTAGVRTLAFAHDGQMLASAGLDRSVQLWEMPSGKHRLTLGQSLFPIFALEFAPAGGLVSVGGDPREALHRPGEVLVVDLVPRRIPVHHGHTNTVTAVALPRLRPWLIITAGADRAVRRCSY